jgi:hypothetical protein
MNEIENNEILKSLYQYIKNTNQVVFNSEGKILEGKVLKSLLLIKTLQSLNSIINALEVNKVASYRYIEAKDIISKLTNKY